jgi:ribokinase
VTGGPLAAVVVVGSVNVDLVVGVDRLPAAGETVTGGRFARHQGGKGANQAVAAARLGARVRMVGAVGDDDLGAGALDALRSEGVDVADVSRLAGVPTGVALILVDAAGENFIAVASGANHALDARSVAAALRSAPPGTFVLACLEVPDEPLVEAARWCRERELRLALNPAPARALPSELLDARPILVLNRGEALALADRPTVQESAVVLTRRTGAPVVVTLGPDGALVSDEGPLRVVAGHPVEAIDATGAGDATCGALVASLAAGHGLTEAVRRAMAAAALSVARHGAREGMPDAATLERFLGRMSTG